MVASREELIRREFDRWNGGEREIDPQVLHHDVVVHSQMTNATYHGHDGVRRYFAEIDDQFEEWHLSIDEFRDASEERLLGLGAIHFRGRASGVEFDQPMAWLLTFAGDQVTELRTIHDHAQALDAAGLREQALPAMRERSSRRSFGEIADCCGLRGSVVVGARPRSRATALGRVSGIRAPRR